jgi:transcriptional regulator with XRE-family HTH domain
LCETGRVRWDQIRSAEPDISRDGVVPKEPEFEDYNKEVGLRLRSRRRELGLALKDVEEASGREFKASVLGAYERGERQISVLRLQRLSQIYGIAVDKILPARTRESVTAPPNQRSAPFRWGIPVEWLRSSKAVSHERAVIIGYARTIQAERNHPVGEWWRPLGWWGLG